MMSEAEDKDYEQNLKPVYQHKWNAEGERCVKCGDKDWIGGHCSVSDELHQANAQLISDLTDEQRLERLIAAGWQYSELSGEELVKHNAVAKNPRYEFALRKGAGYFTSGNVKSSLIFKCYEMAFPSEDEDEDDLEGEWEI
jgi:hypothetical protein